MASVHASREGVGPLSCVRACVHTGCGVTLGPLLSSLGPPPLLVLLYRRCLLSSCRPAPITVLLTRCFGCGDCGCSCIQSEVYSERIRCTAGVR
jgi:hypothetical protein